MLNQTISHYKILSKLGQGGMGVVYKALDTKLDRFVALKFLPAHLSDDEAEKQRFIHEAKAASALDHPNICTIYEINETEDGQMFIAMAYYDGETLAKKVSSGQLSVSSVIDIATQIASGLAKAHEHGITHRDLKPANVMITKEGVVKILDFGLAKLAGRTKLTKTGTTMGTAAYMSPEQVQNLEVDHRTDIWSLGVVMYEMLTGRLPFEGEYAQAIMYAIVNMEAVPVRSLRPEVAVGLESIVHKCLAKEPEERYQTVADWLADVQKFRDGDALELQKAKRRGGMTANKAKRRSSIARAIASAILLTSAVILFYRFYPFTENSTSPSKAITFTSLSGVENEPAFSPDGRQIAFTHEGDIYIQLVGTNSSLQLTKDSGIDFCPNWSPDGRNIAFARWRSDADGAIMLISALGGVEQKLYSVHWDFNVKRPSLSWSPDGKWFAFAERDSAHKPYSIFLLSAETLERHKLTSPSPNHFGDKVCAFSPDGKTLAVMRDVSAHTGDIYVVPITGGELKRLTFENEYIHSLAWKPDGREIIFNTERGGNFRLWRVSAAGGKPEPMNAYGVNPAISSDGKRLAFAEINVNADVYRLNITNTKDKNAAPAKSIFSSRFDGGAQISSDYTEIVFCSERTGNTEIWKCDSSGRNQLQLTFFDGPLTGTPRWSPDGKFIAFDSRPEGHSDVFIIRAEGGAPQRVTADSSDDFLPSWSRDGRSIYFTSNRSGTLQIWETPVREDAAKAVQVTKSGAYAAFESFDGKWIYYVKDATSGGIWKTPVVGGEEILVIDQPIPWWRWVLVEDGIYYSRRKAEVTPKVEFFRFATGEVTSIAEFPKGLIDFALSPDRRRLLFSQLETNEGDIMLVENFR